MRVHRQAATLNSLQAALPPSILNCHKEANKEDSKRTSAAMAVIIQVSPLASLNYLGLVSPMDILPRLTQTVHVHLDHRYTF